MGSSTTTPAGTCTKAPPARNASCRTVNASSDALDALPDQRLHELVLTGGDPAGAHTLGLERGIELVVHDPPVADDDHARVVARLRGPGAAARCALVAGRGRARRP